MAFEIKSSYLFQLWNACNPYEYCPENKSCNLSDYRYKCSIFQDSNPSTTKMVNKSKAQS